MSDDLEGVKRAVAGYKKYAKEDGHHVLEVDYELKPMELSFLQELFDVDPEDPDPAVRFMIRPLEINAKQAKALEPFVQGQQIDVEKYDFMLECFVDEQDSE
ncbi:MAG: hypothetical protein JSR17_13485 [Proteobacteria bacterium]|nr:hypothetical protein [Pseudomonadota bacterium]